MPVFVDIKKKSDSEDRKTGLPDIAKEIYAEQNDGLSPITGHYTNKLDDIYRENDDKPVSQEKVLESIDAEKKLAARNGEHLVPVEK